MKANTQFAAIIKGRYELGKGILIPYKEQAIRVNTTIISMNPVIFLLDMCSPPKYTFY
ncbi:hypothetical protein [Bacillus sp. CH30_1T]|uniref:hypothetical protein n=1 Tax=Bacillus sp. CH30_1T TaxID=2604836 RepID=UPI00165E537C|nr:hypothetical protein [Bacillus sp. CH30_1T]